MYYSACLLFLTCLRESYHGDPARRPATFSSSAAFPNPGSSLLQNRGIEIGVNGKHLANIWRACLVIIDLASLKIITSLRISYSIFAECPPQL